MPSRKLTGRRVCKELVQCVSLLWLRLSSPKTCLRRLRPSRPSMTSDPILQANHPPYRPFDTVPPEISSQILSFTWSLYHGDDSVDRFRVPSILCAVNHDFYRIAHSTPILWSYLRVLSPKGLEHIQARIKYRSGALSLDLYMAFKNVPYDDARTLVESTIMQCPSRFRTITLSYLRNPILQIPSNRSFWDHLHLLNDHPLHATRFFIQSQTAPQIDSLPPFTGSLRHLTLRCNQFGWSTNTLPDSLEVLSIRGSGNGAVNPARIVRFLSGSHFHSLRSLSLSNFVIEGPQDVPQESCTLESLEYFRLAEFHLWEFVMLFSCIHTPNLQHLRIHLRINLLFHKPLPDVLANAWGVLRFPKLHKLTLDNLKCDPAEFTELIQKLPESLRSLEIIGGGSPGPLVVLKGSSAAAICGQLHYLVTHDIPLGALVPLVRGRCPSLRELEARYTKVVDSHTWEDLSRSFEVLNVSVPKLRILEDGGDARVDEPKCLTFEQLAASFRND